MYIYIYIFSSKIQFESQIQFNSKMHLNSPAARLPQRGGHARLLVNYLLAIEPSKMCIAGHAPTIKRIRSSGARLKAVWLKALGKGRQCD